MSEDLKERGNVYFSKSEYDKAIECYTEALKLVQPKTHLLLSNRSAAFSKLKMYDKALEDALRCLSAAPDFARGHLRKAVALNGLQRHSEALAAAEKGYKLRASDRISKDCVAQWLEASTALLKEDVEQLNDIPQGVSPLTHNSLKILLELQHQSSSPGGVSTEILQKYLLILLEELEHLLGKFGHVLSSCMSEWATALDLCLQVDPRTHSAPKTAMELQKAKAKELILWLDSEVDHILYPVIRPVFGLLTTVMLACVSTLFQLVSSRDQIQILTQACLVFYQASILSTTEYLQLHIRAQQYLLSSFCMESGHARNKERQEKEAIEIKSLIQDLKSLLGQYNSSCADYAEVKDSTEQVISNAAMLLPSFSDTSTETYRRLTKDDAKMLKADVASETKRLMAVLNSEEYLHLRDMDSLVLSTGGLIHVGEIDSARISLQQSQSFYLSVIVKLLENKLLQLNDAAECFFHPQTMMICNSLFFAGIDDKLVANILIRWKCLATELYAILARLGLSNSLATAFNQIEAFKVDSKGSCSKEEAIVSIGNQHQRDCDEIIQKWGGKTLHALLDQSSNDIQRNLKFDQMLLQYCMSPLYDTNWYPVPIPPKVVSLKGLVVAIRSEGSPLVRTVDFGRIQDLALESHNLSMRAVALKRSGRSWQDQQALADKTAQSLLEEMFPSDIQSLIADDVAIKRVYFCPDQVLAKFPIEILPFRDGKRLGEKVAITYLSSARELLRESTLSSLTQLKASADHENTCAIFANPNFDLERIVEQQDSHWSLLSSVLSSFFSESKAVSKAIPLPDSEREAHDIEYLLNSSQAAGHVIVATGDEASLHNVLQVQSPHILHIATHGFSDPDFHYQYHNFWSDTRSGLLLAGANTYRLQKYQSIADRAGTGELTALAACGMKLTGTRLVYLSSCCSSYGFIGRGEALSSLAQAFRIAGSSTVIATLWPVSDEIGRKMALHFYYYASKPDMPVSLALQAAKKKLRDEDPYCHWYDWAGFLCIGTDTPLFT